MRTIFLRPARRELKEAISSYNARRSGLGEAFRDEVWETIERIKAFPLAWYPLVSPPPKIGPLIIGVSG